MKKNGSPPPRFSTDDGRTYFLVELPVHPKLPGVKAQDQAHDEAQDQAHVLNDTERRVLEALEKGPLATARIAATLGHSSRSGAIKLALIRLESLGLIELTIPDKPRSRNQMRRLTSGGKTWLARSQE